MIFDRILMNFQLILSSKMHPKMVTKTTSKKSSFASQKEGGVLPEFRAEGVCPP